MASDVMTKPHQLIASDRVEGTAVRRPNGDMIGHIERLMIDKVSGKVSYAVLSFGGFLGMGHSHYPVPWGALKYDTSLNGFVTNVTENQLRDAPSFSDDSWQDRDWERKVYSHYNVPPYWA